MAIVETEAIEKKGRPQRRNRRTQETHLSEAEISAQQAWDESLEIEKRLENGVIVVFANDGEGSQRQMQVYDRPGGFYALVYTNDETGQTFATRVSAIFFDNVQVQSPEGDTIAGHWRRIEEAYVQQ